MQNRSFLAEVNYDYERSHPEEVHLCGQCMVTSNACLCRRSSTKLWQNSDTILVKLRQNLVDENSKMCKAFLGGRSGYFAKFGFSSTKFFQSSVQFLSIFCRRPPTTTSNKSDIDLTMHWPLKVHRRKLRKQKAALPRQPVAVPQAIHSTVEQFIAFYIIL